MIQVLSEGIQFKSKFYPVIRLNCVNWKRTDFLELIEKKNRRSLIKRVVSFCESPTSSFIDNHVAVRFFSIH
jgi:hypothetical protein